MRTLTFDEQNFVAGGDTQTYDDGSTLTTDEDGNVIAFTDVPVVEQSCAGFADFVSSLVNMALNRLNDRSQIAQIINFTYYLATGSNLTNDIVNAINGAVNRGSCSPADFTAPSSHN